MIDFYELYSNIQNLKEICFLILIFIGTLAMFFFLEQDKLKIKVTEAPLVIVLIIGILEGIFLTYQTNNYEKKLKQSKVENVKAFETNIENLKRILGSNKYQINKILNEFYQNNKSIQSFDIKNIDLHK